jgi:hypothetical protein
MQNRKGYVCGTFRKYGAGFCSSHSIKGAELIEQIRKELRHYADRVTVDKAAILEKIEKKVNEKTRNLKKVKEQIEQKNEMAKLQKGKLVLKFASGEIGKEEYELALQHINAQLAQYQLNLAEFNDVTTETNYQTQLANLTMHLDKFMYFDEINREVLNRFIDKVIVDSNSDIEIHYKFYI